MKRLSNFIILVLALTNCQHNIEIPQSEEQTMADPNKGAVVEAAAAGGTVDYWLTKGDQSVLLQQQTALTFGTTNNRYTNITVDTTQTFQTIDGFGYTLTTGSAYLINHMTSTARTALLQELFGNGPTSIGISYLRVNVGASDLSPTVYSYDDLPAGQTDPTLQNFSLAPDEADMIPVLQQILTINPNIKVFGSPWSPPKWMKDNNSSIGGRLLPQYYSTFANYLVKYIQGMQTRGITIDAITIKHCVILTHE